MTMCVAHGDAFLQTHSSFVSLFCGCGGLDLGFIQAGFRCRAAFDSDPVSVVTYRQNLGDATLLDLSRNQIAFDALQGSDLVLAGPPCQGFSTLGKRNPEDVRNDLLVTAGRIALRIRPKVILVENVVGVIAGRQKRYWNYLLQLLRDAGYSALELRCEASQMGVPQRRTRMVMLAWNTGSNLLPILPTRHGHSLALAIQSVEGLPNHTPKYLEPGSKLSKIANRIGPGQKLSNVREGPRSVHTWDIAEVFGNTSARERNLLRVLLRLRRRQRRRDNGDADPVSARMLTRHLRIPVTPLLQRLQRAGYIRRLGCYYDLCHTFNGKFRRLRSDEVVPTVDTRFGDPWYFLHPTENRAFTVREAARFQGFPDWFEFPNESRSTFRLIGNAVPPPMARCLADFIRKALF